VDPRSLALTHVGPVYLTPQFIVRDLGFDTNVFNTVDNPQSDFTVTFVPEISAAAGIGRSLLWLRSSTEIVYFATHESERSVNEDLRFAGRVSLGRASLFADGGYLNTRQRPSEEIDARSRREELGGEVGVNLALSSRVSTRLSARNHHIEYDADAQFDDTSLARTLNRDVLTGTIGFRFQATPLSTLIVAGDVARNDFTRSPIRDSDTWRVMAGADFHPRALVGGTFLVGYQHLRPDAPVIPEFSGLVGTSDLSFRLIGETRLDVSLDRGLVYSYAELEPYYINQGFGVALRRRLTRLFDLEVRARRMWQDYRRLVPAEVVATTDGRMDTVRNDSALIAYRMTRRSRMTFGVEYWERRSDERDYRNYDGLRVGTTIAYGF
jgi:hypothetical protein